MPNIWAHRICAGITLRRLGGSPAAELIRQNIASFRLGCQGADLMYFCPSQIVRGKKGMVYYANRLHAQPIETLMSIGRRYLKDACGDKQFAVMFSYICGFLCHHYVDQSIHKLIYARKANFLEHRRIELDLDAFLTRELNITHDKSNACWAGMGEFTEFAALAQWYNYILHDLYNKKFSTRSYVKDYKALRRVSIFLDRPFKRKHAEKTLLPPQELRAMMNITLRSCFNVANTINMMYYELGREAAAMPGLWQAEEAFQAAL